MIDDLMVDVLANLVKRHRRISLTAASDILGMDFEELTILAHMLSDRDEFELLENSICFLMPRGQDAYRVRLRSHYIEKFAIGRLAASFILPGDHVVTEAGSTMTIFAQHLAQIKNIRVSTNSYAVASTIIGAETAADIHVIGGNLYSEGQGALGPVALETVGELKADWGVICPVGVSVTGELMYYVEEEAKFARAVIASCKRLMVLCNSSKIGVPSRFVADPCARADLLVVDSGVESSTLNSLVAQGVKDVHVADVEAEASTEIVLLDL
ncbi:HTH-type transcriptional repressor GlcR [Pseudovibrio axinellae]|uniref:HTH-type transcriptional repressor GlcR n=1 Tax=Pseudovibrio axinellae TaxID=989403 RepID=A0A165XUF2_9HYPH|nr:DeoR/GlpR family DNA-binding transcription regulator [Pseudovibrio axinellae]KZL18052.1 HTH-type transcriptional repressor GlcR [Pseudovibrio axinellae]SER12093.1 DNA-binding transcriptional regulator of sugar metabolism, DeoR/GlpR family [Pseudovibrio axinellae]